MGDIPPEKGLYTVECGRRRYIIKDNQPMRCIYMGDIPPEKGLYKE